MEVETLSEILNSRKRLVGFAPLPDSMVLFRVAGKPDLIFSKMIYVPRNGHKRGVHVCDGEPKDISEFPGFRRPTTPELLLNMAERSLFISPEAAKEITEAGLRLPDIEIRSHTSA